MGVPLKLRILGHLPYNIKKLTKNIFSYTYQWEYTGMKI